MFTGTVWQTRAGLREDITKCLICLQRYMLSLLNTTVKDMLLKREEIVIFSNWKCSLPVNELGCTDKLSKSGHPIKQLGKFPFWYPFSFFHHVSFVKKHSSWNEIKGFYLPVPAVHTNSVPCLRQIRQCHFVENHSVSLPVLISSEFSMTKTIWDCLKAKRSDDNKHDEILNVWKCRDKTI